MLTPEHVQLRCHIQERKVGRDKGSHKKEELLLADVGSGPHGGAELTLRLKANGVLNKQQ